jgi:hypothetical protein
VALAETDVSEERIDSIFRLIFLALKVETIFSSEMPVLRRATRCHIPEEAFFIVAAIKNLKYYITYLMFGLSKIIFLQHIRSAKIASSSSDIKSCAI